MTSKITGNEYGLMQAILLLENFEEAYTLFRDLCTPKELKDFSERFAVAKLLYEEKYSYREISKMTGVSLATIGRVSRFLNQENYKGYKKILEKISKNKTNNAYKIAPNKEKDLNNSFKNFSQIFEDENV